MPLTTPPSVRFLNQVIYRAGLDLRFRLAEAWQVHLYRYRAELWIGDDRYAVEPGWASIVAPDVATRYRFIAPGPQLCAHFALPVGDSAKVRVPAAFDLAADAPRLWDAMDEALTWFDARPARTAARVWDVLWQLVDIGQHPQTDPGEHPAVAEARSLIERHLAAPLTVAEIARQSELSHNHLLRLFRRATGRSIAGYIRRRRADRALYLLRRSSMPIKSIAIEVGVPDLQQFNKLMRDIHGRSPRQLRQTP